MFFLEQPTEELYKHGVTERNTIEIHKKQQLQAGDIVVRLK